MCARDVWALRCVRPRPACVCAALQRDTSSFSRDHAAKKEQNSNKKNEAYEDRILYKSKRLISKKLYEDYQEDKLLK